jgi:hypothetical protein
LCEHAHAAEEQRGTEQQPGHWRKTERGNADSDASGGLTRPISSTGDRFPTSPHDRLSIPQETERRRMSGGARFPLELEARGPELSRRSSLVILPVGRRFTVGGVLSRLSCRVVTVNLSSVNP